jgi:hypothetical protein
MCGTEAVGDEHHFIFMCPALAPVRERFCSLFASGTPSLRLFTWQQGLCAVVRFVHEWFLFCSSLLVAARLFISSASSGWTDVMFLSLSPFQCIAGMKSDHQHDNHQHDYQHDLQNNLDTTVFCQQTGSEAQMGNGHNPEHYLSLGQ